MTLTLTLTCDLDYAVNLDTTKITHTHDLFSSVIARVINTMPTEISDCKALQCS